MSLRLKDFLRENRVKLFLQLVFSYLLFQLLLRLFLFISSPELVSWKIADLLKTLGLGAFYDFFAVSLALLPFFLLYLFLPAGWLNKKPVKSCQIGLLFVFFALMLFLGLSQYFFWEEFQTNFNFIAVDYLIYTTEVLGNIQEAYNLKLLLPLLASGAIILAYQQSRKLPQKFSPLLWRQKIIAFSLLISLPVMTIWVVDSKWRNAVSANKYNVEIAANGPYEFVSAFFNNELDYESFYLTEDQNKTLGDLKLLLKTPEARYLEENSVYRAIESQQEPKRPHIVMIVVESLSASFMASFGNQENLTPNLDRLTKESLFFTNVYATGTRTVRGLEALSLSLPPTPGQSIVRRPENEDMFLLGTVLKENGYKPHFLYGGYGYFDNMNAFFAKNGYQVTDRTDLAKSEIYFETVWGVADEIIFDQALKEMDNLKEDEKAFQLIVTTSNHSPYNYPENRIDLPVGSRKGAVKYTDWAINDFLSKAQQKDWFSDTVFVIVADHQASAAGKVDLPVHKYHIPLLIYSPTLVQPGRNDRLMSQIDLAPTLLGLLGFSYNSKFLGYDLNNLETGRERVFISTYQNLGYIKDNKIVILKPQNKIEMYEITDFSSSDYKETSIDEPLIQEAIAWYQGSNYLYKNKLLKAPRAF